MTIAIKMTQNDIKNCSMFKNVMIQLTKHDKIGN